MCASVPRDTQGNIVKQVVFYMQRATVTGLVIVQLGLVIYTLFQNGRHFSVLLFACKLALVASLKGKYSFVFRV